MFNNKFITYWVVILPIFAVILTSFILTSKFISFEKKEFEDNRENMRNYYINNLKDNIKNRIDRTVNLIETNSINIKKEEKRHLKNIVNIGYKTIETTYNLHKNSSYDIIIKEIRKRLEPLRFYDNASGYFFIIDLNNKVLMQPQKPEHTNKTLTHIQDSNGKYIIQSLTNIAKTKGEGYDTWSWYKENSDLKKMKEKIGYIKVFKPLNLYIGTAIYNEDIEEKIKYEAIKLLDISSYGKTDYIFAIEQNGRVLTHKNKSMVNKDFKTFSKIEQDIITNILEKAKNEDGEFITYTPTSFNIGKNLSEKISFVKTIKSLNWTIGTGLYTTSLEQDLANKQKRLTEELSEAINNIIIISLVLSIFLVVIMAYIAINIHQKLSDYEDELSLKNATLKELNDNLEGKVLKQVKKMREKDDILFQQSKLASMGEMIGNIAHQWRQPLSTISTVASGIKLQNELGINDSKSINESLDAIVKNTKTLSQTIDDFRNFFKKDKTKIDFKIEDTIERVLTLMQATLKMKNITVVKDIDSCKFYGLENELTQALLNILNNAKDALLLSNEEEKYIFITVKDNNKELIIKIKDNANGIDPKIINRVFEPYFTTKFSSNGTGIGLYMTQSIIVKNMNGKIKVSNKEYEYKKQKFSGAEFEIVLRKNT
ncbi:MAG: cache domain-containing protein [Poseidonibacter sp.]|uniref:sensor histidine kinase n=1 Tax=Poseidonibacter sp. TaxID=2321188 RepID=UPI00359F0B28